jgi:4-amino-4-deoxy-L-arabinose transferase-like glycosyltransferase
MKLLLSRKPEIQSTGQQPAAVPGAGLRHALSSWEIYLILLVAAFLRLFNIDRVIFGQDEANVYQLAHDAIVHGLLPLTSNKASIGNLNPPMVVYFFLLPASLSANPLWGQVLVALLNTAAVLLTYFFTRRYYGRLAGTIAALLFATAVGAWQYSRHIWSPNLEPLFVTLFIWMLFRGVVERKKGWFFPAVALLGILYQFHGSTLFLTLPLGAAVLLAFKTIRWREIGFALLALLLLFAPFIFWEFQVNFLDLKLMFANTQSHTAFDPAALHLYLFFIHPLLANPYLDPVTLVRDNHLLLPGGQSILDSPSLRVLHLHFLLNIEYIVAILLLTGGIGIAAALVLLPQRGPAEADGSTTKRGLARWWADFQASPFRQGLLLLLLWQVAPLVLLTRHSLVLFAHYFIFLLPGEFILMAFCVTRAITFLQKQQPEWSSVFRYGMATLAALTILGQFIGSGGTLIDLTTGNFNAHSVYPHYTDLYSLQNALRAADRLARQRGIHRIYALEIGNTASAMNYLSEQVKTPIELNNVEKNCFVLPAPEAGPVLFLTDSETQSIASIMFNAYTNATLVEESPQLGTSPYRLYILSAKPWPVLASRGFNQGLQLLSPTASVIPGTSWLTTRWRILDTHRPASRTNYHFDFHIRSANGGSLLDCQPTATWAGDQMFTYQPQRPGSRLPAQLTIQVSTFTSQPPVIHAGPLTMTSFTDIDTPARALLTPDGQNSMTLPVAAPA